MNVVEAVAEAQAAHDFYRLIGDPAKPTGWLCRCGVETDSPQARLLHRAEAIVSAIKGMTVGDQAALIGGEVGYWSFYDNGKPYSHIEPFTWIATGEVTPPEEIAENLRREGHPVKKRALGPWVEVQP